jgi:hypothetical protein
VLGMTIAIRQMTIDFRQMTFDFRQMTIDFRQMTIDFRHCEPTGPRKARPDDRLREAIHLSMKGTNGLLRRFRSSQ